MSAELPTCSLLIHILNVISCSFIITSNGNLLISKIPDSVETRSSDGSGTVFAA